MSLLFLLGTGKWTMQGLGALLGPMKALPGVRNFTVESLRDGMELGKKGSELARDQRPVWLGDSGILLCPAPTLWLSNRTHTSSVFGIHLLPLLTSKL